MPSDRGKGKGINITWPNKLVHTSATIKANKDHRMNTNIMYSRGLKAHPSLQLCMSRPQWCLGNHFHTFLVYIHVCKSSQETHTPTWFSIHHFIYNWHKIINTQGRCNKPFWCFTMIRPIKCLPFTHRAHTRSNAQLPSLSLCPVLEISISMPIILFKLVLLMLFLHPAQRKQACFFLTYRNFSKIT